MREPSFPASRATYVIAQGDDVAVALRAPAPGEPVGPDGKVRVRKAIPRRHKVARRDIRAGEVIRKCGWPIGRAIAGIACQAGEALLEKVLATASGASAPNEENDEREIAIWKGGVTL